MLPKLPRDAGDRNRTSPFAFTGNKFEFRAVSSNQSIAFPNIALNVAVAESLDYIATELEKARRRAARRSTRPSATLLPKMIKENKRIIFNGNNYSDEWQKEAGKRGLLNLKNTVDALPRAASSRRSIKTVREVQGAQRARAARALRGQRSRPTTRPINIEAQLMVLMANRYILPAALEYQKQVAQSVAAVKAGGRRRARRARSCSTSSSS